MTRLVRAMRTFVVVSTFWTLLHSSGMAGEIYSSGGTDYAIERFPAQPNGTLHKVVVLIHGSDGLKDFGSQIREFAEELERKGYLVVIPNYFGLSDSAPKNGTPDEQVQRLSDAIDWANSQVDADKDHVGLVGYSLGSALSLVYAEKNPGKIKALVDYYGPTDPQAPGMQGTLAMGWTIVKDCAKLPPTLILHNRDDEIVPMKLHSVPLIEALRKTSVICDFEDYPGGDPKYVYHTFLKGSNEDKKSKIRTINWLTAHL